MRCASLAVGLVLVALASPASADDFTYMPPGSLIGGSGQGRVDENVYAPGILFPIDALAYANSQVWGNGGSQGPGGGQCDAVNYTYPWRDNYCETRSWDMPLCPAGTGHQGQDIRPETCENLTHWVVAVTDGTITNIGSYSIYLTAPDGTRFDYLHSGNVQVTVGQDVQRGDKLSQVSNEFGGTATTIHLHFNIRQNVDGVGSVYVPPYLSLVDAYEAYLDEPPVGALEQVSCNDIRGWAFDGDQPEEALDVLLRFDTPLGAVEGSVVAGGARPDLCEELGSCDHGFAPLAPLSLFDGGAHLVHALVGGVELATAAPLQCSPPELEGVRRAVTDEAMLGWAFDELWDVAPVDPSALPVGEPVGEAPELVVDDSGSLWLVDDGRRRAVSTNAQIAWRFDASTAQPAVEGPEGPPLSERPLLARDGGGQIYLVDAAEVSLGPNGGGEGDPVEDAHASCACRVGENAGVGGWAWLAALALGLRRRRQSA